MKGNGARAKFLSNSEFSGTKISLKYSLLFIILPFYTLAEGRWVGGSKGKERQEISVKI